jgi:hypothetical protein
MDVRRLVAADAVIIEVLSCNNALLEIRRQGEHSCAVAIPDGFIGVDDVDSPGQRR